MAKKSTHRTFNDVIATLGSERFDVAPAQEGAKRPSPAPERPSPAPGGRAAFRVNKYGCAAEIAAAPDGSVLLLARPGVLLNGEISRLLDRGYQKFFVSSRLEIPATADHLRSLHEFSEELKEATGGMSMYNESLGTTSDVYQYDRVKGRPTN